MTSFVLYRYGAPREKLLLMQTVIVVENIHSKTTENIGNLMFFLRHFFVGDAEVPSHYKNVNYSKIQ